MIDKDLMQRLAECTASDEPVVSAEEYLREGPLDTVRQQLRQRRLKRAADVPSPMSHCAIAVAKQGKDADASVKVCKAMMKKAGYASGSNPRNLTPKGRDADRRHSSEEAHPNKLKAYKALIGVED